MTLNGRQIRQARTFLRPSPRRLAHKVYCITALGVRRTEENEDGSVLSEDLDFVFRRTLERLGVDFKDGAAARLRKGNGP